MSSSTTPSGPGDARRDAGPTSTGSHAVGGTPPRTDLDTGHVDTGHVDTGRLDTGRLDTGRADTTLERDVVARQEERYGGIKIGSAFFGWLTATGVAALLTTLLAAAGTAFGLSKTSDAGAAVQQAADSAQSGSVADTAKTIGITGAIALLVVLFVAYYCGGYVAGRMARFNGTKQGLAVWLWAVVIAIVVAVLGAVAGAKYDVLAKLNLPRIPINEGSLTTAGVIALVAVALASLAGALLGGKAGMRYHRKVDDVALTR